MTSSLCGIFKNKMNLFTKQKPIYSLRKQNKMITKRKGWEFDLDINTLLYLKQITSKGLLLAQETVFNIL